MVGFCKMQGSDTEIHGVCISASAVEPKLVGELFHFNTCKPNRSLNMKLLTKFVIARLLLRCGVNCVAETYVDSLTGSGLLGSHFGKPFFNASFDYVVIGGGTAGLALATRLAQNSPFSVAVIEAGGLSETDNGNLTAVPAYNGYWVGKSPSVRNPLIDWGTITMPMPGFGNKTMLYASGKTLGGGSSRNSLNYHRFVLYPGMLVSR
jgi:choline dehydrogenase